MDVFFGDVICVLGIFVGLMLVLYVEFDLFVCFGLFILFFDIRGCVLLVRFGLGSVILGLNIDLLMLVGDFKV